jgi:hypothetical protein
MKLRKPKTSSEWPANRIEHWPLQNLKPFPLNSRLHSKADVDAVAASMVKWGVTVCATNPPGPEEDISIQAPIRMRFPIPPEP